jgi:hypothetical protein
MKVLNFEAFMESVFSKKVNLPIYYSDRLQGLLIKMRDSGNDSVDRILSVQNNQRFVDDVTLFDLSDREDVVTFIQVNRLERMRTEEDPEIELSTWISRKWYDTNVSLDFVGWTTQRTNLNVGRFFTRVFKTVGVTISDRDRETLVNSYKSVWKLSKDGDRFELVKGEDIRKWYLETNYQFNKGQLSNSCMRYERCQKYLDIYVENPEVCSLLILHGEDMTKIVGRALVWVTEDGSKYLDRIYTNFDSDKNLFMEWAKKNGIEHSYQNDNLKVRLNKSNFNSYPYMDTFFTLDKVENLLTGNEDDLDIEGRYELRDTSGRAVFTNRIWSEYHGEYIDRDDAVYCRDIDGYVCSDNARYLSYKDEWVSENNDDIVYSDHDGEYYYQTDTVYSEYLQSYIYSGDAVRIRTSTENYDYLPEHDNNAVMIDILGKEQLVLTDSVMKNPFDGKWVFKEDPVSVYWCEELNRYVSSEYAEKNGLEIDRSRKDEIMMRKYLTSLYPEDLPSERELLEYVSGLEPTEEQMDKIREISGESYELSRLGEEKVWKLVLYAIYNFPPDRLRGEGFRPSYRTDYISKESDVIVGPELSSIIQSRNYLFKWVRDRIARSLVYDVIEDPKMLMAWSKMKNS